MAVDGIATLADCHTWPDVAIHLIDKMYNQPWVTLLLCTGLAGATLFLVPLANTKLATGFGTARDDQRKRGLRKR